MKKNSAKSYTDITIILDRSGSMHSVVKDTICGFNQFIEEQQKIDGRALLSLIQFDDRYEPNYEGIYLQTAQPLTKKTYTPRGSTALLDAIGKSIFNAKIRIDNMPKKDRPDKIIFVILTDGEENSSREYNLAKINEMISHQRNSHDWSFVFLGANQDAIANACKMGISTQSAITYTANNAGTGAAFASASASMTSYRGGSIFVFSDADRTAQKDAEKTYA